MGRRAAANEGRTMTPTRIYVETVQLAKILAEGQGISMADYLDRLVKEAAARDGEDLVRHLQELRKKPER